MANLKHKSPLRSINSVIKNIQNAEDRAFKEYEATGLQVSFSQLRSNTLEHFENLQIAYCDIDFTFQNNALLINFDGGDFTNAVNFFKKYKDKLCAQK